MSVLRAQRLLMSILCIVGAGCGYRYEPGVEVEVRLRAEGASGGFVTDLGYQIELKEASLVVDAVEILPCESTPSPLDTVLRWLTPVGQAHAHGVATPTRLATPVVADLMEGQEAGTLAGYLYPPASSYCGVQVAWGPADADALWIETAPAMEGLTLQLAGTWSLEGAEAVPFELEVSKRYDATAPPQEAGGRWEVDLVGSPHRLWINLVGDRLLDGVELETIPVDEIGDRVLLNLPGLMTAEVGGDQP